MLRFTIRDMLWLTALAGLACAWWADHRRAAWDKLILNRDKEHAEMALRTERTRNEVLRRSLEVLYERAKGLERGISYLRDEPVEPNP